LKNSTFFDSIALFDKSSAESLNHKVAENYGKFKTKNIKMNIKTDESRSKHVLVSARDVSLGYDTPLFDGVTIDLREGEALELRGRNGAGKSTLIKRLLGSEGVNVFSGELSHDPLVRIGVYEQEVSPQYFKLSLHDAIERIYLDNKLSVSETKIRQLMSDYLFTESDGGVAVERLSGGQKARLQIIAMLANDPQLLILDEPTNHLDLPSIEELETALARYTGAVLYVSHDDYFRSSDDSGQMDAGLNSLFDFRLHRWTYGLQGGYIVQLPDSLRQRVSDSSASRQVDPKVSRDLGDWYWGGLSVDYRLGLRTEFNVEYSYLRKFMDRYKGHSSEGLDYSRFETGTDQEVHQTRLGAQYVLSSNGIRGGIEDKWVAGVSDEPLDLRLEGTYL
jgi:ABC-type Mn2+/Zn2+ transport system ATPase subunit